MTVRTFVYYFAVAALFTHEMDAVIHFEWRLLFHLRELPDVTAAGYFVALHFPLFLAFFYFGHHPNLKIQTRFRAAVSVFLVVHAVLHFRLSDHDLYAFEGLLSNLYIYGAAFFGASYLALLVIEQKLAKKP